jgi:hypothetical protein
MLDEYEGREFTVGGINVSYGDKCQAPSNLSFTKDQASEVAKFLEVSQPRAMSLLVEFERDDFEVTFEDIIESKGTASQRQDFYQRKIEMLLETLELNSRDLTIMRNNRKLIEQALSYQSSMVDADHQS